MMFEKIEFKMSLSDLEVGALADVLNDEEDSEFKGAFSAKKSTLIFKPEEPITADELETLMGELQAALED